MYLFESLCSEKKACFWFHIYMLRLVFWVLGFEIICNKYFYHITPRDPVEKMLRAGAEKSAIVSAPAL